MNVLLMMFSLLSALLLAPVAQADGSSAPAPARPAAMAKPGDAAPVDLSATSGAAAFAADKGRNSYAVGIEMARNFRKNDIDMDLDQVLLGMKDGLAGKRPPMGEKELRKILNNFQNIMRAHTMANQRALALANRQKGEAFFAKNKAVPGVKVLVNGVQYTELKSGNGVRPTERDVVVMNWRGTTLDGTEYDSSEPGKPMKIAVSDLFNGWRSAVTLMQEGSHWQVWVPSAMAYGERGVGADVGPNETLLLDIELLKVLPHEALGQ